jgi:hypothetical protein
MLENHYIVELDLLLVMFVVVEGYEPNLNDFVEEFLELNLIVDNRHVRVFELKAIEKKIEYFLN